MKPRKLIGCVIITFKPSNYLKVGSKTLLKEEIDGIGQSAVGSSSRQWQRAQTVGSSYWKVK